MENCYGLGFLCIYIHNKGRNLCLNCVYHKINIVDSCTLLKAAWSNILAITASNDFT